MFLTKNEEVSVKENKRMPLTSQTYLDPIIHDFLEDMEQQQKQRQNQLTCGVFSLLFGDDHSTEQINAICFSLREVVSSRIDSSSYGNNKILFHSTISETPYNILAYLQVSQNLCQDTDGFFKVSALFSLRGNRHTKCVFDNDTSPFDMEIHISNGKYKFYYGLDGKPSNKEHDFVTIIAHEVIHGLGFYSAIQSVKGGAYSLLSGGETTPYDDSMSPTYYDACQNTSSSSPSSTCLSQIEKPHHMNFYFMYPKKYPNKHYPSVPVYITNPFLYGISLAHIDERIPPLTCRMANFLLCNSLMFYSLSKGEAIHRLGGAVLNKLADIGYNIIDCTQFTNKYDCIGETKGGPRCDWCVTSDFCSDVSLVDYIDQRTCENNAWLISDYTNSGSALSSIF